MLDNLLQLVRDNASDVIGNNPAIPADRKQEAIKEAGSSIVSALQQGLGTNAKSVLGMLTSGNLDAAAPLVKTATGSFMEKLVQRFGLSAEQATGIAGSLIPMVMGLLAKKTADPSDKSFDAQGLINELSGGNTGGIDIPGLLTKVKAGMDKDGDGDVDFNDLKQIFSSGSTAVVDKIKGWFK